MRHAKVMASVIGIDKAINSADRHSQADQQVDNEHDRLKHASTTGLYFLHLERLVDVRTIIRSRNRAHLA